MAEEKRGILVTGASGMLGRYVKDVLTEESTHIFTLGRNSENDFQCDLKTTIPGFGTKKFHAVVHCVGTESPADAMKLNLEGTRNLLCALEERPPHQFVYVSSSRIYGADAGENVTEDCEHRGADPVAKSKLLAERLVADWAEKHGVTLTIIRPARMFGNGVAGETLRMFNDAVKGYYIHIRGNEARVSIVAALDVAKGIRTLLPTGGIYNAADGHNPRLIDMMEAMTANAGQLKRMPHLPAAWCKWLWRGGRWIPWIDRNLNPESASARMKTLTIDGSRLAEAAQLNYYNTLEVISLTCADYPYEWRQQ